MLKGQMTGLNEKYIGRAYSDKTLINNYVNEMKLKKNKAKVFISYAREDYEIAEKLYNDLKRTDIVPWLDIIDLNPGQNWKQGINQAIKESSYFLALLSSRSISEIGYVQKELKIALGLLDEFPLNEIFIIPVRLDDCVPADERLQNLHCVNLSCYKDGLNQILRTIGCKKSIRSMLADKLPHTWHFPCKKDQTGNKEIKPYTFISTTCGVCDKEITDQYQTGGGCLTPVCKNKICTDCWSAERDRLCKDCRPI